MHERKIGMVKGIGYLIYILVILGYIDNHLYILINHSLSFSCTSHTLTWHVLLVWKLKISQFITCCMPVYRWLDAHPSVEIIYVFLLQKERRICIELNIFCDLLTLDAFLFTQVLVMTAQILLNILRHSIIKMDAIHLLILDECHHAVKKHPYSLVMSEFYHTTPKEKRPAVFGMTASPVNLKGISLPCFLPPFPSFMINRCFKRRFAVGFHMFVNTIMWIGVTSQEDCAIKIRNLESKLDSVVCTIKDRKELEKHVPMPLEVVVQYDKAATLWSLHEQIKQMESTVEEAALSSSKRTKWQFMGARDAGSRDELRLVYGVSERTESDGAANLIQKLRAINYALGELGQWCAYKVFLSC